MAWRMKGTWVGTCSCRLVCPCPVDGPPTGPDGRCDGNDVFHIDEGERDGVDLGGLSFAVFVNFPGPASQGGWKLGVVIDAAATDEQAEALGAILSGSEGGPFEVMATLVGESLGVARAPISFRDGEEPAADVEGMAEIRFEAHRGIDGSPTTVRNAKGGFAPEYRIGRGSGSSTAFGIGFVPSYGEAGEFEYSSEMAGEIRPRA